MTTYGDTCRWLPISLGVLYLNYILCKNNFTYWYISLNASKVPCICLKLITYNTKQQNIHQVYIYTHHKISSFNLTLNLLNFLNGIIQLPFLGICFIIFLGVSSWVLQPLVQSLSDCMVVQAGLALYWWQRPITSVPAG